MSHRKDGVDLIHAVPVPRPSRWISSFVVGLLALFIASSLYSNPNYKWDVVGRNLLNPKIVSGVGWTLLLTFAAMTMGIVLAIVAAIMRSSSNPVLRGVSWGYIWFFRGTPIYTQLTFWGLIGTIYPSISVGIPFGDPVFSFTTPPALLNAMVLAIIGLGLNEGAYLAEIMRAGLNSVDPGQTEAAKALGMRPSQIMRRIVLPQAMRVIVPPTGNETISMLKTTSLVLAVPFTLELQFAARTLGNRAFQPVPYLIVAALWYLLITSILMVGQFYLERHFGKGFDARSAKQKISKHDRAAAIAAADTTKQNPFLDVTP